MVGIFRNVLGLGMSEVEIPFSRIAGRTEGVSDGRSSGIGRAVAIAFAEAGAEVVINFIGPQEAADEVVATIQKIGTKVVPIRADVSSEDEVQGMFKKTIEELGTIDILVNNAGIQIDAPIDKMTIEQWNSVISTNLTGQFLCAREAIREFKRRGIVPAVSRICRQDYLYEFGARGYSLGRTR